MPIALRLLFLNRLLKSSKESESHFRNRWQPNDKKELGVYFDAPVEILNEVPTFRLPFEAMRVLDILSTRPRDP